MMGVYSGIIPLYFFLKKKNRKVGVIFSDMDSWFNDVYTDKKKFWYKKYSSFNYALEKSDYVDFLSPYILNGVRERGIDIQDERVTISRCSFTDYTQCKVGNKSKFEIAFSGRLEKDKNPLLFLEAALLLTQKFPKIVFHILGEGRLSNEIKERIEKSGRKNIIFHGFLKRPTEILAKTSVFVSIQISNNYPSQSVLEAMACSNAIIASDVGDTRMFVNETNGILIDLNLESLLKALTFLITNPEKTKTLGSNAVNYVIQNHRIDVVADYYINLFQKTRDKINAISKDCSE